MTGRPFAVSCNAARVLPRTLDRPGTKAAFVPAGCRRYPRPSIPTMLPLSAFDDIFKDCRLEEDRCLVSPYTELDGPRKVKLWPDNECRTVPLWLEVGSMGRHYPAYGRSLTQELKRSSRDKSLDDLKSPSEYPGTNHPIMAII
ncbi:hypothetical protein EYR41_004845 [Orbilia oligospora]|uniref:Uncharacterized protein n=1 Tax=Orbilia oligospora TaxID=2813651 RepID=A0A8H2HJB6_ORBOL|nr:hypothetical protein EYR41_004845 [Orbilia oligospora]